MSIPKKISDIIAEWIDVGSVDEAVLRECEQKAQLDKNEKSLLREELARLGIIITTKKNAPHSINSAIDNLLSHDILSKSEERILLELASQGDNDAVAELVLKNAKIVYSIVNKRYPHHSKEEVLERLLIGLRGVIKAIKNYDLSRTERLSSFASNYIISDIKSFINSKGLVYFPKEKIQEMNLYSAIVENLLEELHRPPTLKEIAKKMNLSEAKVRELQELVALQNTIYYPTDGGEDDGVPESPLASVSSDLDDVENLVLSKIFKNQILQLMEQTLSEREQRIISQIFGLNGIEKMRQAEIANREGVTSAMIYKIKNRAIAKMEDVKLLDKLGLLSDDDRHRLIIKDLFAKHKERLTKRERTVITKLFGLEGEESLFIWELAKELQISREEIKAIKEQAVEKLKLER